MSVDHTQWDAGWNAVMFLGDPSFMDLVKERFKELHDAHIDGDDQLLNNIPTPFLGDIAFDKDDLFMVRNTELGSATSDGPLDGEFPILEDCNLNSISHHQGVKYLAKQVAEKLFLIARQLLPEVYLYNKDGTTNRVEVGSSTY